MPQEQLIGGGCRIGDARHVPPWDDQNVGCRDGMDVAKGDDLIVGENDCCWYGAVCDATEDTVHARAPYRVCRRCSPARSIAKSTNFVINAG